MLPLILLRIKVMKTSITSALTALAMSLAVCTPLQAQTVSLDSCRSMALRSNKGLRMADEAVRGAQYTKKAATAAYLPAIDASATYMYNPAQRGRQAPHDDIQPSDREV